MRIRKASFLLYIILVLSCGKKENATISGKLIDGIGQSLQLYKINPAETKFIDTVKLDNKGAFVIDLEISNPTFYRINIDAGNYIFLLVEAGEKIELNGRFSDLQRSYSLKGSKGSQLIREYMKQFDFAYKEKIKIAEQARYRIESGDSIQMVKREAVARHEKMKNEIVTFTKKFIKRNKCSLASVFILDLQLGRNDPVLTMKDDFEYYKMVDSCLSQKYAALNFVSEYNKAITRYEEEKKSQEILLLNIGSKAPEIILPDKNGDTIKLSDVKSKYKLVVFWASWNRASRLYNKNLKVIYEKYKNSEFDIFQVGIEKSKARWASAIEEDELSWIQVYDIKLWESYVAKKYQVFNVPSSYLVDDMGNIIEINMEIERIDALLARLLK